MMWYDIVCELGVLIGVLEGAVLEREVLEGVFNSSCLHVVVVYVRGVIECGSLINPPYLTLPYLSACCSSIRCPSRLCCVPTPPRV